MPNNSNIAIDQNMAVSAMAEIRSETERFLSEMESEYSALSSSFAKSEGDFITALKAQLSMEQEVIHAICDFFQTLLDMMYAADTDFNQLDSDYAEEKIK